MLVTLKTFVIATKASTYIWVASDNLSVVEDRILEEDPKSYVSAHIEECDFKMNKVLEGSYAYCGVIVKAPKDFKD